VSAGTPSRCAACVHSTADGQNSSRGVKPSAVGSGCVVALAGNPNTGKSAIFNALTGLRQHTGNWPGKTVARAEGRFDCGGTRCTLVDLPGTYSLLSATVDEEVARDFILFGRPACTIIVVDATTLERNLNLTLQVLEITDRVVVALNLIDEARRRGLAVDPEQLARDLGVPVVPTIATTRWGLDRLVKTVAEIIDGRRSTAPRRVKTGEALDRALNTIAGLVAEAIPGLPNARWVAMRLLDGDARVRGALTTGELAEIAHGRLADGRAAHLGPENRRGESGARVWALGQAGSPAAAAILSRADQERRALQRGFRDGLVQAIYADAEVIAARVVRETNRRVRDLGAVVDRVLTSPVVGLPVMAVGLAAVFWITIVGANYPSQLIASLLFSFEATASAWFAALGVPVWLTGFLWEGVYRGLAWVVSVMLPPMAIFFPLFTLLEDLGLLPRVAFNMDRLFKAVGAHGKQALTMAMGFGCNAAGVIACRVIDSPRERLLAILTNNFVPCNGRFPTLIMLASVFVAATFPPVYAAAAAAGSIVLVVSIGVAVTLLVSAGLSRTILRGEPSSFTLELPPYRKPRVLEILYTSLIDRTLFVLYRAVVMAAPAGGVIWLLSNVSVSGRSLAGWMSGALDPLGRAIGLDGVILLAYVVAIPANEIVVPTILMVYSGAGAMLEIEGLRELRALLVDQQGWTLLTAACLMLFSLLHNPCSTTIWTIYKETGSVKWTTLGALLPLSLAFAVTFAVAQLARLLG
jgi:ferrous iron transport protein B